ncbi:hypothetical protein KR222_006006, partial [Zaprionus bogoriensis]
LSDPPELLIAQLGDCDVVPVEYMDLVNHRVRCHRVEIFNYDDEVSFTAHEEEEEEQQLSWGPLYGDDQTDDVERTLELVHDLDCLIRRIEQMQLQINEMRQEQRQEWHEETTDQEEQQLEEDHQQQQQQERLERRLMEQQHELNCEEKLEVRSLQKLHQRLQCEIDEMICNFGALRQVFRTLRSQMATENRRLRKLGAATNEYHAWSLQVAQEMNVCQERYLRLLDKKLSKSEAEHVIVANFRKTYRRSKAFVSWRQLRYDLREFHLEIAELVEYADDLRKEAIRRFS